MKLNANTRIKTHVDRRKPYTALQTHANPCQIPSGMSHSVLYQLIIIQRASYHSLCLCGKLGIKHAPASRKHKGLRKGQFVSFNCCLSAERNQIMQGFVLTSKQCRCDHYGAQPPAE